MLLRAEGAERKITLMIWLRVCLVDAVLPQTRSVIYTATLKRFFMVYCATTISSAAPFIPAHYSFIFIGEHYAQEILCLAACELEQHEKNFSCRNLLNRTIKIKFSVV